jgi:hypothetical protein
MSMEERVSQLERLAELQVGYNENVVALLSRVTEVLEETREDVRMTRRLWVRLSQRYGWLDDDGLFGDEDDNPS